MMGAPKRCDSSFLNYNVSRSAHCQSWNAAVRCWSLGHQYARLDPLTQSETGTKIQSISITL